MVCLCTVGPGGWPLNVSENTLCGGDKETLRAGSGKGWGTVGIPSHHVEGKEQIQATWTNVTSECLQGGKEKGEELKDALNKFINTLVAKPSHAHPSRRQLGEGNPGEFYACTGSKTYGVCVMYYPNDKDTKTWWKDLQTAIKEDEEIQKQREEEEKRKQQEKVNDKDQPRAERLSATPTTTNQTEASKQDNLTDKLRRLNITSGTPISMPSSWLLRAVFLF
ncbi:unnamed protein product [Trypanosoma congolense IL3000]|nr:unnamed protein product [Trypanosoma congolense IL3000]